MLIHHYIGFLNTPPLWTGTQFGIEQFHFPQIDLGFFKPKPIPERVRLGHRMEYVCKQLIEFHPDYEIILHNLPVRDGKRTIGEIDFILREVETEKIVHIELTYKFYIIDPKISDPIHRLIGPNKRDMFFTKMEKIKNEQFQLVHAPKSVDALDKFGIDHREITHKACYKAQLFLPYRTNASDLRPLNPECVCGFWLQFDDFNAMEFRNLEFYIPLKTEWVVEPHSDVKWKSHFETLLEVNLRMLKKNAPMLWMKRTKTDFEKFFVVWW
jgi:hypothetical protein